MARIDAVGCGGRYAARMEAQYGLELDYRVFTGGAHLAFSAINMALSVGGLYYGGGLVRQGKLEMTDLMLFMQYSFKIGNALGSLLNIVNDQQRALISAAKVFATIRRKPLIARDVGDKPSTCAGLIQLRNVTFCYPTRPASAVITGLDLELRPGTVTALVGGSGNGKSTIAWLLQRFYDPSEGAVTLDGRDVRELDLSWLRGQMAIVSQEPMLFHGTVADNIRYGQPGASDDEVMAAAREANADEFVAKLPEGYQTTVSQVGLSAGQRQRISIARAILKNPRILILDEATSQLDAKSEGAVQDALDRLMQGRTVLVIAHRLSTIKDADNICVLEGGQVVEQVCIVCRDLGEHK
jgi:ABC-type multidrug transport system fused ATPase/permease subunit